MLIVKHSLPWEGKRQCGSTLKDTWLIEIEYRAEQFKVHYHYHNVTAPDALTANFTEQLSNSIRMEQMWALDK